MNQSTEDAPASTPNIEQAIAEMRKLGELPEDWDDEGSGPVPACTLRFAENFLRWMGRVPIPNISPGPKDSIDMHWKLHDRELLANITPRATVSFYGDRDMGEYGSEKIQGSFCLHRRKGLVRYFLSSK